MGVVTDAVNAEIEQLSVETITPGMAALATSLAMAVDEADAPTVKAVAARELRAVMADLRKLAPAGQKGDVVDAVGRKREERRRKLRAAHEGS